MKKLHLFIIRSFLGPFIATFFIAIFLLLMQFLWKWVDDLVGKGLEISEIAELLFFASVRFVPLALPQGPCNRTSPYQDYSELVVLYFLNSIKLP